VNYVATLTEGLADVAGRLGASPQTVVGEVESKSIVGIRDGTEHGVVLAHADALNLGDPAVADAFDDRRDVTVGPAVAARLEGRYDAVEYALHLSLAERDAANGFAPGRTVAYRVPRAAFDRVQVGERIRGTVARGEAGDSRPRFGDVAPADS